MRSDIVLDTKTVEIIAPRDIKAKVKDIRLDSEARRGNENKDRPRRALVHNFEDGLTINWADDYPGGVKVEGHLESTDSATFNQLDVGREEGNGGVARINDENGDRTIQLGGGKALLELGRGAANKEGTISLRDHEGAQTIVMKGKPGEIGANMLSIGGRGEFEGNVPGSEETELPEGIPEGAMGGIPESSIPESVPESSIPDPGNVKVNDSIGRTTIDLDGAKGEIHADGKITAKKFVESDVRCKEDIVTLGEATDKVCRLRGVSFRWKQDYGDGAPSRSLGLVAQEVKEVLPEAVSQDDEGYLSIAYGEIVPVLIEAMKEQQETIEDQQQTIDELRAKNQTMQQTLQEVEERVAELEQNLEQQAA